MEILVAAWLLALLVNILGLVPCLGYASWLCPLGGGRHASPALLLGLVALFGIGFACGSVPCPPSLCLSLSLSHYRPLGLVVVMHCLYASRTYLTESI